VPAFLSDKVIREWPEPLQQRVRAALVAGVPWNAYVAGCAHLGTSDVVIVLTVERATTEAQRVRYGEHRGSEPSRNSLVTAGGRMDLGASEATVAGSLRSHSFTALPAASTSRPAKS
jgi:hypothetical protein